ncbi:MAG TPA: DUF177 domain-containing protein [Bacteroidota bacterium]|nr:DUF177 domain-containing protein [Bacteroidota bacterium]
MKPDQGNGDKLKIRVSGLSAGSHEYSFTVSPPDILLGDNFHPPVSVDVRLEKTARQIVIRTKISATGEFPCDRCLNVFNQDIAAGYAMVYAFDEQDAAAYPPEEVRIVPHDVSVIDLAADVREMILLSVPLKLVCREECRGLCSSCGSDLNTTTCHCRRETTNLPWQGLEKLLKH